MKLITGKQPRPRRILNYGQHGVGKSTWAAGAPDPVFIDVEGGLGDIDCAKTEKVGSYNELCQAITLLTAEPQFRTIVIDTVDWAEQLIFKAVAGDAGKESVGDLGFGKGYEKAAVKWISVLESLEAAIQRGKGIVLLGHAKVVKYENPETQSYDRYEPDLHKSSSAMIQEWCDEVLFSTFRVFTRTEEQGFGKERTIAIGGKERYMRTNESAVALAKCRLKLPDELPMNWAAYAAFLGGYDAPKVSELGAKAIPPALAEAAEFFGGNISGLVADGSSKTLVA